MLQLRPTLKHKIIEVCNVKIAQKGDNVGLSFYAFFANKNDNPALLMEAATWWIETHKLDHFEKAVKIKKMVESDAN
jgi:cadmium resistance protein CadD (predicted permease)